MFRHLLVPTDGSPPSRRALRLAARLAGEQKPKARLTALWVAPAWEPGLYAYGGGLPPVAEPRAYGIVETDDEGRVQRFLEKPEEGETTSKTINAGIYVIEPSVLDHMGAAESISFEYDLFPALLRDGVPVFGES